MTTTTTNEAPQTNLYIPDDIYQQVMYWVNKSKLEVSGLGKVMVDDDGDLMVTSAFLLPQECGGASTDLDPTAVAKAIFTMKDDPTPGEIKWWWHSHVQMGVFWSNTDRETIAVTAKFGWFAATVFNQKEEYKSALAIGQPVKVFLPDISTHIPRYLPTSLTKQWDADFAANVKEKSWSSSLIPSWRRGGETGNALGDMPDSLAPIPWHKRHGSNWWDEEDEVTPTRHLQAELPGVTAGSIARLEAQILKECATAPDGLEFADIEALAELYGAPNPRKLAKRLIRKNGLKLNGASETAKAFKRGEIG